MRGATAFSTGLRRRAGAPLGWERDFDSASGVRSALVLDYSGAVGGQFFNGTLNTKTFADLHTFTAASLQCEPFFTDWGAYPVVQVYHEFIVPESLYSLQAADAVCGPDEETLFSLPMDVSTSLWGDVTGWIEGGQRPPPDGRVNIVIDVLAILNTFSNRPFGVGKARADLEPAVLDHRIRILDVVMAIDAFRGLPYPFEPSGVPCTE